MKSLGEIIKLSCDYIRTKNSIHTRREVEELIAFTLNKKRLDLYLNFDKPLTEDELARIRKNLTRLASNEPLQYIEGNVDFYGCTIHVDKRVLIPRPETEYLVDLIVQTLKGQNLTGKTLWDICTGSGCIGIALKKALPDLTVVLSDISSDALSVAKRNAEVNDVSVTLVQGDLLAPFAGQKADFIVSNPPYIAEGEYSTLDPHVKNYEPKNALVSGPNGLECYRRLFKDLQAHLTPGAKCWFEIGNTQGEMLLNEYPGATLLKDLNQNDRFIHCSN